MGVDRIVGEIDAALPAIAAFVLQPDLDLLPGCAAVLPVALGLEEQRLRTVEGKIDRIERVDRGEQGAACPLASCDQIAGVDAAIRDAAADRGADAGRSEEHTSELQSLMRIS